MTTERGLGNRDFDMNALINYNAGILGRTPTSTGNVQANMANPMMGALSGAVGGFGAGGKIGDYSETCLPHNSRWFRHNKSITRNLPKTLH